MPNRILRPGILSSERVDALSYEAEVFYRRLMSKVDDYGRFDAHWRVLRSELYPMRTERISQEQIETWLEECTRTLPGEEEPLVRVYSVGRKQFLELTNFRQRIRVKAESKYPEPATGGNERGERRSEDGHMRAYTGNSTLPPTTPSPTTPSTTTPPEGGAGGNQNGTNAEKREDLESRQIFDELVEAYPPAGRERLEKARERLREALAIGCKVHGLSRAEVLEQIRDGLARWKLSERWQSGRVHAMHNWLREGLWREHPVAVTDATKVARRAEQARAGRG